MFRDLWRNVCIEKKRQQIATARVCFRGRKLALFDEFSSDGKHFVASSFEQLAAGHGLNKGYEHKWGSGLHLAHYETQNRNHSLSDAQGAVSLGPGRMEELSE
jgi:hypothetical protein